MRDDYKNLGINLTQEFLICYLILQEKYNCTLNQGRFLAENPFVIQKWFDLCKSINAEYGILNKNTYNIDKNDYMMSIAGSTKIIFLKY